MLPECLPATFLEAYYTATETRTLIQPWGQVAQRVVTQISTWKETVRSAGRARGCGQAGC